MHESYPYAWNSLVSPEHKVTSAHTIPKAIPCHFTVLYRNHQYMVDCKFLEARAWSTLKM